MLVAFYLRGKRRRRRCILAVVLAAHVLFVSLWRQILRGTNTWFLQDADFVLVGSIRVIDGTRIAAPASVEGFHRACVPHLGEASRRQSPRGIRRTRIDSVIVLVVLLDVVQSSQTLFPLLNSTIFTLEQLAAIPAGLFGKRLRIPR